MPDWIGELTALTDLLLDGNQLSSLPTTIASLDKLIIVDMYPVAAPSHERGVLALGGNAWSDRFREIASKAAFRIETLWEHVQAG